MLGVLAGWYLRKWWLDYKAKDEPAPPKPLGVYQGRLTCNQVVGGPLSAEAEISEPDENGQRRLIRPGRVIAQASEWVSTFFGNQDGQLTIRFHRPCDARDGLRSCNIQDEFRIEIYRVKEGNRTVAPHLEVAAPQAYHPFGGDATGGTA